MKRAQVYINSMLAGILTENDKGYEFQYDTDFLKSDNAQPVSLTLPLSETPYHDKVLFPFFDGLIPDTSIVMPEDDEELALTLNGKKRKIKRQDFEKAMLDSGMDQKAIDNLFKKFAKVMPKWSGIINQSFLSNKHQKQLQELIERMATRIGLIHISNAGAE